MPTIQKNSLFESKMNKYKLRAECSSDIVEFISKSHSNISSLKMKRWNGFPDVEIVFRTNLESAEIIDILNEIEDSHIMIRSLIKIKYYNIFASWMQRINSLSKRKEWKS